MAALAAWLPMWPFLSHALFPPPTEAWLQTVSSDPKAQGWGAWARTEKTPLEPGSGGRREAEEDNDGDAGFLLSLLESESLPKAPEPDQVTARWWPAGTWAEVWGQRDKEMTRGDRAACLERKPSRGHRDRGHGGLSAGLSIVGRKDYL